MYDWEEFEMKYHLSTVGSIRLPAAGLLLLSSALLTGCITHARSQKTAQNQTARSTDARAASVALTGKNALGDWTTDAPGVRRHLSLADLPPQYATPSIDNGPHIVARPKGAWPKVPRGFKVEEYVTGLENPRHITTAPNGDIFIVESEPGRVKVLRDAGNGKPQITEFATGLSKPFGLAFYPNGADPQYVYIANTDSVVRFHYKNGDTKASGPSESIVAALPGGGRLRGGGHWTRDLKFSLDGKQMFVSVGSISNVHERAGMPDERRADILAFTPDGKSERIFASGIRNAVGLAIHPTTGELWMSVNERDGLGDQLVPDYISHVQEGGFYGWPWYYMGGSEDKRATGEHSDLKNSVITPDVLLQSHSASLCLAFYTGNQFPRDYVNDGFAAEHGSWNRSRRTGYKVVRVPLDNGKSNGDYIDFMTGFVTREGNVWGRPVGVTVAHDGALLVTDDATGTLWRVTYTAGTGKNRVAF